MAKTQSVEVGAVYRANVGGKKLDVRIERETWNGDKHTGWGGINLATNRPTTIKAGTKMTKVEEPEAPEAPSPAPVNAAVPPTGGKKGKAPVPPGTEPAATGANVANDEPKAPEGQKRGGKRGKNASADTKRPAKPKPPRRPSLLDLAADVLTKAKAPMTCGAIVEAVLAEKLWTTAGKTPAATLYSAIVREISAKGNQSRFVKADRGLFASSRKGD